MRADSEPWFVPMRMALPRLLHFSTRGANSCKKVMNQLNHCPVRLSQSHSTCVSQSTRGQDAGIFPRSKLYHLMNCDTETMCAADSCIAVPKGSCALAPDDGASLSANTALMQY